MRQAQTGIEGFNQSGRLVIGLKYDRIRESENFKNPLASTLSDVVFQTKDRPPILWRTKRTAAGYDYAGTLELIKLAQNMLPQFGVLGE
jgi:hypothetical protein